jgi:hypothetical protein
MPWEEAAMNVDVPIVCGLVSTAMFVAGTLPMLVKAAQTRDLGSYSLGNIAMSNVGNLVNSVYVLSLPPGPVWALHGFYVVSTALMLFWYLRYAHGPTHKSAPGLVAELRSSPDASASDALIASIDEDVDDASRLVGV